MIEADKQAVFPGKKILFVVNYPWFFLSHRLPLALKAQELGCEVHVATMPGSTTEQIVAHGLTHHELPLSASGRNPLKELVSLIAMYRLFRAIKPDLVHLVTIKPVLYGGMAARLARVPAVVAAISGLGFVFSSNGRGARLTRALVKGLYQLALRRSSLRVIFQNTDDQAVLLKLGAFTPDQTVLVKGSGVDLAKYAYLPEKPGSPLVVVMASRLLYDKGVREYVDAARLLHKRDIHAQFLLVGDPDPGNPQTVSDTDLAAWRDEGVVECLGQRSDIASIFANAHLVVLPSYREGLPKVLAEAAACGRAVVTSDAPGCRDAIVAGKTGLLVDIGDAEGLAAAISRLLLDSGERQRMGCAGRKLAEHEFSLERIVGEHLAIYSALLT